MPRRLVLLLACASLLSVLAAPRASRAATQPVAATATTDAANARSLYLHGRYAQATAAYEALAPRDPVAAALGIARCRSAGGELEQAIAVLAAAVRKHPEAAVLAAEQAALEFERGHHDAAQALVDSALSRDSDQLAARFLSAELDRVAGRLDKADDGYRWFVRYYNHEQERLADPEAFRWIGLAAAQNARWNRNSGQFHFLVNTLFPDALARDSTYWPIHLEAARLFAEKYNTKDANDELNAALAINPNAAELHAARARIALQEFNLDSARAATDRALALNPKLQQAWQLRADVDMLLSGPRAALPSLERARTLDPGNEETLGRLAAAAAAIEGGSGERAGPRAAALIAEAVARNPHCGTFFATLAASFEMLQRYPEAARYYDEARHRMPQLVTVPGQLGLLAMRLGDEPRAKQLLTEAFEIDPFNTRVKNSLDVLDVLVNYGSIETPHFLLRFDRSRDSLLARYAARRLEARIYPEIVKQLGYAPTDRSLMEIFSSANGTSGHGWFSRRMVGLPFIGTVGACAGKVVAITSPNDGAQRFNWARVLRHEFVHVVNLQQSDFRIPRWFTEGLAVHHEGAGHPAEWDRVLARRVAVDNLYTLANINMGFVRPSSGEDWTLAYYQAELYTRYMEQTFGAAAPGRLIAAYADNLDTPAAVQRSFGVTLAAFEAGYRKFVTGLADRPAGPARVATDAEEAALARLADEHPGDAAALARLARAGLERGPNRARASAEKALAIDPRQQQAAFVVARVAVREGDPVRALEVLRAAYDPAHPDVEMLSLFADLSLRAKAFTEAESLITVGAQRFPGAADWDAGLVPVYRAAGRPDDLAVVLARRAGREPDDAGARLELARLALERKAWADAATWADAAIDIDVSAAPAHAALARALVETHESERAIEEYETAIRLDPADGESRQALARLRATPPAARR